MVETIDVVENYITASALDDADIIMLLQPTCPFRSAADIGKALHYLLSNETIRSVVSVVEVGGNHPFRMKRIVDGMLIDYIDQGFEDMRPRQLLPKVYIRSGSIYLTRVGDIRDTHSMAPAPAVPVIENPDYAINIDSVLDFHTAEAMLEL